MRLDWYSKTHEAMWRAADAAEPDVIPKADRKAVFSEYQCLYSIAEGVDGLELRCCDVTLSKEIPSAPAIVSPEYCDPSSQWTVIP
ncbi:hypothetical protein V2W45_1347235 [Cenococcum geophilum]